MERKIGERFYSEEYECWYRVARGRANSCKGCDFAEWYDNGDSDCNKPYDEAGECLAEYREDGLEAIFKEV